jgi:hypothetical protein
VEEWKSDKRAGRREEEEGEGIKREIVQVFKEIRDH